MAENKTKPTTASVENGVGLEALEALIARAASDRRGRW